MGGNREKDRRQKMRLKSQERKDSMAGGTHVTTGGRSKLILGARD